MLFIRVVDYVLDEALDECSGAARRIHGNGVLAGR